MTGLTAAGRWRRLTAGLVLGLLLAGALWPGAVAAQPVTGEDLLRDQACRTDPDSELCICRDQFVYRMVPANVDYSAFPPTAGFREESGVRVSSHDFSGSDVGEYLGLGVIHRSTTTSPAPPRWNDEYKRWEGDLVDMELAPNRQYYANCSLSYLRENLQRLVYIVIAIASVLFAVSLGWAGFVHMQETATGGNRAVARTVILRAMLGMILLAGIFVVWEAVSGAFLQGMDIWDLDPRVFDAF